MKIIFIILAFLVLSGAAFFMLRQEASVGSTVVPAVLPTHETATTREENPDPITAQVAVMPLEEKIGQMLIVGFGGTVPDAHITKMIARYHIGGINLLKRNVTDAAQVRALTSGLQSLASVPLFIAADQEGGAVVRFSFLDELTPESDIESEDEAEAVAERRGAELAALGINTNFSPVVDYVANPNSYLYSRTFGANATTTGRLGEAMMRGYLRGGVIPVVKHFPGYGSVGLDPHRNGVMREDGRAGIEESMAPFASIISKYPEGAIMTAHISVPEIDTKPATLSPVFLTQILRERFGFRGVIITDDMEMISAGTSPADASLAAIKAGADMIISTYTPEVQIAIYDRLYEAVRSGEITESRINESVTRILRLKATLSTGR
ncbi:hypothetical protein HY416_03375 [Candidatus Kaiserbacteria bacterium]|nr:hypothetical protein [Candidatus Kaiserbacteria bacterium]